MDLLDLGQEVVSQSNRFRWDLIPEPPDIVARMDLSATPTFEIVEWDLIRQELLRSEQRDQIASLLTGSDRLRKVTHPGSTHLQAFVEARVPRVLFGQSGTPTDLELGGLDLRVLTNSIRKAARTTPMKA